MGLAESKRKQRISVDPQNKTWTDDKSKFGYQMLMKMGWEEGKGLGKDEDGSTQLLEVKYKVDNVGLGVTKKDPAQETFQQLTSFEDVLQRLCQDGTALQAGSETKDTRRAKRKKDRVCGKGNDSAHDRLGGQAVDKKVPGRLVHRQKFIRNKRVDQYSARHLQEILGTLPAKNAGL